MSWRTGNELHAPLPLTASVMEIMQAMLADGCGEDDHGQHHPLLRKAGPCEP